jgi:hypothetical protein
MLPETMMGLLRVTMVAVLSIGEITCASAAMASRQSTSADSWPASATILDSAQAPLPVVTPISSPGNVINPLEGKPLRYLIGIDFSGRSDEGEITEVSYNTTKPRARGISVQYCNLFDEENTGRYGPYLHTSDTAAQYGEGQIDPRGPGWMRNLQDQFERATMQGAGANAFGGTVTLFGLGTLAVKLHEHGVVNIVTKGTFNGFKIGPMAVCCELDPVCQS